MRIVLVEDQLMFREFIRRICVEELGHKVVGEAEDGIEALEVLRKTRPEVVLLDLKLPGDSGFGVAEKILPEMPQLKCLFISAHCDDMTVLRVERARVHGFIDKTRSSVGLIKQALEEVAKGKKYFSPRFQTIVEQRHRDQKSFDKLLTDREQEVLSLIGCAMSNEEIAALLGLAVSTVETHRRNLLNKLSICSTPKLIQYAIEHGFTQYMDRRKVP